MIHESTPIFLTFSSKELLYWRLIRSLCFLYTRHINFSRYILKPPAWARRWFVQFSFIVSSFSWTFLKACYEEQYKSNSDKTLSYNKTSWIRNSSEKRPSIRL